jgi:hypothetical protein
MQFDWPRAPCAAERAASAKTKPAGGEGPLAPLQRPWACSARPEKRNATNGYVDIADRRFDLAWINGNQIGAS